MCKYKVHFNFSYRPVFDITKKVVFYVGDSEDFDTCMRLAIYEACNFKLKEYPKESVLQIYSIKYMD